MSQRLRGEPSRKSNAPKLLAGVVAIGVLAWLGSSLFDDDGSVEAVGVPTAEEADRAAEKKRRARARKGRAEEFTGADATKVTLGNSGRLITYSAVTEETTGVRAGDFARDVDAALGDPRSWTARGAFRFKRVKAGDAAVRIVLGTPATVDKLCLPLETKGEFSCRKGSQLNINLERWLRGTDAWPLSIRAYRNHVINHEMGHFLGYDHVRCPSRGNLAPVMMQQTKDLGGCKANEWPFPDAGRNQDNRAKRAKSG